MASADLGCCQETPDGMGLIAIAFQRLALFVLIVGQAERLRRLHVDVIIGQRLQLFGA